MVSASRSVDAQCNNKKQPSGKIVMPEHFIAMGLRPVEGSLKVLADKAVRARSKEHSRPAYANTPHGSNTFAPLGNFTLR